MILDETDIQRWKNFLEENYRGHIEDVILAEKKTFEIDYEFLELRNPDLADSLMDKPTWHIEHIGAALKQIIKDHKEIAIDEEQLDDARLITPTIRFKNFPGQKNIRNIRVSDLGKMVVVEGIIRKATKVRGKVRVSAYQCQKCGAVIRVEQHQDIMIEPAACYEEQGGCGRATSMRFISNLSKYVDFQKIELAENPEENPPGREPAKIACSIEDDLVDQAVVGDRIKLNGILQSIERRQQQNLRTIFDLGINTLNLNIQESMYSKINITTEDIQQIKTVANDPEVYTKLSQSIAPSISGWGNIKLALILQLFGGIPKTPHGNRIRGDIHILLVGDPALAKSQLLRYIYNIAPRAVICDGKGSTAAGLTGAVTRDAFGEGQWVLEAGALVLADGGIACIDELDKMNANDRESLHVAMEQQEVNISKAGINASLKTRCSLLAAANPKMGRFELYGNPVISQIDLKSTLISRFDLIFPMFDIVDSKKDQELATHLGKVHQDQKGVFVQPIYLGDFIRKHVTYARETAHPQLTNEALETINTFYVELRNKSEVAVTITPRQLEAMYRLAEASAKIQLRQKVTIEDANTATLLMDECLKNICQDEETGQIDIDIIQTGITHTQRDRMRTIVETIEQLIQESVDNTAQRGDILIEAEKRGIPLGKIEDAIDHLERNGQIYDPKKNQKYRLS